MHCLWTIWPKFCKFALGNNGKISGRRKMEGMGRGTWWEVLQPGSVVAPIVLCCVVYCVSVVAPITEMAAKKCLRVSDQPRMLRRDNSCQLNPRVASQNIQRVRRNANLKRGAQRSDQRFSEVRSNGKYVTSKKLTGQRKACLKEMLGWFWLVLIGHCVQHYSVSVRQSRGGKGWWHT